MPQSGSTDGCGQDWDDTLKEMEMHVRGKLELCSTWDGDWGLWGKKEAGFRNPHLDGWRIEGTDG